MTTGNQGFYEHMKLESFMEFARLTGFDKGIDIDIIYPYIANASILVELGSGYGRAIDFILKKGFQGQIIAVDRIPRLVNSLKEQFGERLRYVRQDIVSLKLPTPVEAIVWLWSGLLELTIEEQKQSIANLYHLLAPGGVLIVESPHKQIKIVGEHASAQHIKFTTDWGELNAYLPTELEVKAYSEMAGFSKFETLHYSTYKGLDRIFYMLYK
jgi:SAM-dependent methyltransferase